MQRLGNKKLSKAVSTKVTAEDYKICQKKARDYYIHGKIKSPSISELIRLVLSRVLDPHRSHTGIPLDAQHPRSVSFRQPH